MSLVQVIHRIATDSEFAAAVATDPRAALHRAGIELEEGEFSALVVALNGDDRSRPPASHIWYESQLDEDKTATPPQSHIWYESQLGAEHR